MKKLGMTLSEIEVVCRGPLRQTYIAAPYWTAEVYSFGKYIREYCDYPKWLPLCVFTDHGPGAWGDVHKVELSSTAPMQLYHSPRATKRWRQLSNKPCFTLYSPAVYYRRSQHIQPVSTAIGTLIFPAHSTASVENASDIQQYIEELKALPHEFQPIAVCLHIHDINKGLHHVFLKHKIPVYTAGNNLDERFIERFYEILKQFKFASSNAIGSYVYYAIEMGIPFFIYGQPEEFVNNDDQNIPLGRYSPFELSHNYRLIYTMFAEPQTHISKLQKAFIESELGLFDGLNPQELKLKLFMAFFAWLFSTRPLQWIKWVLILSVKLIRMQYFSNT